MDHSLSGDSILIKKIIIKKYGSTIFSWQYYTAVISITEINQYAMWKLQRAGKKKKRAYRIEKLDENIVHFVSLVIEGLCP